MNIEQLLHNLDLGRGIIIGTSTVVSRRAHTESREQPGLVNVRMEKDAGETYLGQSEKNKFVHIYVLHHKAEIDISYLANRIRKAIYKFLQEIGPDAEILPGEFKQTALNLTRRINLLTGSGRGTILAPYYQSQLPSAQHNDHIHILANLPLKDYTFINWIIEETEKALTFQGIKLRPVKQIIHIHAKKSWPQKAKKPLLGKN